MLYRNIRLGQDVPHGYGLYKVKFTKSSNKYYADQETPQIEGVFVLYPFHRVCIFLTRFWRQRIIAIDVSNISPFSRLPIGMEDASSVPSGSFGDVSYYYVSPLVDSLSSLSFEQLRNLQFEVGAMCGTKHPQLPQNFADFCRENPKVLEVGNTRTNYKTSMKSMLWSIRLEIREIWRKLRK